MSHDIAQKSNESIADAFAVKARTELVAAQRRASLCGEVASHGPLDAQTVVFKGQAGPAETAGGSAMSGPDGEASLAALKQLGWDSDRVFFAWAPICREHHVELRASRIRGIVEAIDPELVVALDADAAAEVATAFGLSDRNFGHAYESRGRVLIAVDGLEASLADDTRKLRVWNQFKAVRRRPIY
ncbi:MAG: hypothetical protein PF636_04130 [Actinomycetota bacterium]|nr:hypothetical protein [Actinomycetota bacterium]